MKMKMDNCIISREELAELLRESEKLRRLENAGVDNWIGYDDAFDADLFDEASYEEFCDLTDEELTKNYPSFAHPVIFK